MWVDIEQHQLWYLIHSCRDNRIHAFSTINSTKVEK